MSDLVIRGGTVIDGTGTPGVRADVAIDSGKITEIGAGLEGDRELDATGQVVTPGSSTSTRTTPPAALHDVDGRAVPAEPQPEDRRSPLPVRAGPAAGVRRSGLAAGDGRAVGRGGSLRAPRWQTFTIAESARHPELDDRPLTEVAAERGSHPFELLLDLALDEPDLGLRFACTLANDDGDEVAALLRDEQTVMGLSDAGAHVGQICDAVQATDFLGTWVRDRQLMTVERAVRRLTGAQADLLGLSDRGRLAPGAWADVVVFDPSTVAPGPIRRVADFPAGSQRLTADQPEGVRHVLVNGVPIRVDGTQDLTARSGQLVRPGPHAPAGQ
jgi:N-acyl-D-aspartate/D-glutamate deacylase